MSTSPWVPVDEDQEAASKWELVEEPQDLPSVLAREQAAMEEQAPAVEKEVNKKFKPGFSTAYLGTMGGPSTPEELTLPPLKERIKEIALNLALPAYRPLESYFGTLVRRGAEHINEIGEAAQNIKEGQPVLPNYGKVLHSGTKLILSGIPLIGEAANRGGEFAAQGNYPALLGNTLGTLTGVYVGGRFAGGEQPTLKGALGRLEAALPEQLARRIPSKSLAETNFKTAMGRAANEPVNVGASGQKALDIQEFASRGGSQPKVIRDFVKRMTDPDKGPLTYKEARDFESNASRLSADETKRLTPQQRRNIGEFRALLHEEVQAAAERAGAGTEYSRGMKQFSNAMKTRRAAGQALKYGGRGAAGPAIPWLAWRALRGQ